MNKRIFNILLVFCFNFYSFGEYAKIKRFNNKNYIISTVVKNGKKVISYDLNKDKKVDRIDTLIKSKLSNRKQDTNFDGQFNLENQYFIDDDIFQNTFRDNNHDGNYDQKEVYKYAVNKVEVKIFRIVNGKYVFLKVRYLSRKNKCEEVIDNLSSTIIVLNSSIEKVFLATSSNYITTNFGYKIDKLCLKKWGVHNFEEIVEDAATQGAQCLQKLVNSKSVAAPGALNNLISLQQLWENSPVTVSCSEDNYDWTDTRAHASTNSGEKSVNRELQHPYISLNPSYPKSQNKEGLNKEIVEMKKTVFHEQLHNLGFRHGDSVEYSSSCADCCFKGDDDLEIATELACKICAGNYKGDMDVSYFKDFYDYSMMTSSNLSDDSKELAYKKIILSMNLTRFTNYTMNDKKALLLLSRSIGDIWSPVGVHMAEQLTQKFPDLKKNKDIKELLSYSDYYLIEEVESLSRPLSEVYMALYAEHDSSKAMGIILKNKNELNKMMSKTKFKNPDMKYLYQAMNESYRIVLYEIWNNKSKDAPLNKDGAASDNAYLIYNELNKSGVWKN